MGQGLLGAVDGEPGLMGDVLHVVDELLEGAAIGAIVQVDNRPVLELDALLEGVATAAHVPGTLGWPGELLLAVLHVGRFEDATLKTDHFRVHNQTEFTGNLNPVRKNSKLSTHRVSVDVGLLDPLLNFALALVGRSRGRSDQSGQLLIVQLLLVALLRGDFETLEGDHGTLATNFGNWQKWIAEIDSVLF